MKAGTGLDRIGQIAINVYELERATHFYRDTLGMKLLFEFPGLAFFDCGGVRLMLSKADRPEFDHPASILYYKVNDIQARHQGLVDAGVKIEEAPHMIARMADHDLWISAFRDTEGNYLALMSEVPRAD